MSGIEKPKQLGCYFEAVDRKRLADVLAQTRRGALSRSDQLINGGMPLGRAAAHAVFVCTN
jgi:hypothetical protein